MRDLVEAAMLGEVANGVAAIAEAALDSADGGLTGDDAFEAGGVGGGGHGVPPGGTSTGASPPNHMNSACAFPAGRVRSELNRNGFAVGEVLPADAEGFAAIEIR